MSASRFPCHECAEPFDTREEQQEHWELEGHGPDQVQLDAVDRARYSIMGDDAPPPESAYHANTVHQRHRLRVITGGRR